MGYQNFFATRLFTDVGAADTTITLETPPTETSGRLTLEARNPTKREIIGYTGVSGNDITGVTRGLGGTSATTHLKNSLVEMNLTAEDIQDLYDAYTAFVASNANGWIPLLDAPNTVTALGNRSYSLVFTGDDHTDLISKGMRLLLPRTVAAPTQCTDLEASSSQYYSKTSPTAMTFTDDFVTSAWIKLESYGAEGTIVSRYNGTSGWKLNIGTTGQVQLVGYNAGAGNYSFVRSYQSLPLNKWVHVAAQLDMSAFTATTTTSYVMIDGVDVPASVTRAGTNPTALVQAGDLQIGRNNTSEYFDGKIAQVAIYNAKVTQATILASMNQTLSGSETSLVSAYSFNNSINDLSANANNLTANAGAVATNADSPFAGATGTNEYGIVTNSVFSTNTTLTVQVPEGYALPTTGGVSAISYSTQSVPYGFPINRGKWRVECLIKATETIAIGTINTWTVALNKLTVPIGSWARGYQATIRLGSSVSGNRTGSFTMESSAPTNALYNQEMSSKIFAAAGADAVVTITKETFNELSAQTVYNVYGQIATATGSETWYIQASEGSTTLYAELALL